MGRHQRRPLSGISRRRDGVAHYEGRTLRQSSSPDEWGRVIRFSFERIRLSRETGFFSLAPESETESPTPRASSER